MASQLTQQLVECGLMQFGLFQCETTPCEATPSAMRLRLDMLPSYPDVLQMFVSLVGQYIETIPSLDFLVCTASAIPLASVLSYRHRIPLIYSRGQGEVPVHDLVGAYDVGHPACLIVNTFDDLQLMSVLDGAQRTGLEISRIVSLMDVGLHRMETRGFHSTGHSLLRLQDVLRELCDAGWIRVTQMEQVLQTEG